MRKRCKRIVRSRGHILLEHKVIHALVVRVGLSARAKRSPVTNLLQRVDHIRRQIGDVKRQPAPDHGNDDAFPRGQPGRRRKDRGKR